MSETIGFNITANVDGVVKGVSLAADSVRKFGDSTKAAQSQLASLNKQAQDTARSITEGYRGLGAALGMGGVEKVTKATIDAQRAMGMLGAEALKANRAISASMDDAARKVQALYAAGKSVTEGYKGLGAAMGMQVKPIKEIELANQSLLEKLKAGFAASGWGMKKAADENEKSTKRMVAANEKVGYSIRGWLPHIRTAAASIGIYLGVRTIANIIKVADTFTEMGARLRLVSGNTQELARAQEGLFKIAQSNRAPLTDVVNLYFKLGNSMRDLGVSQKDVLQTVDTVGKAMRVSGASTIEISAAMQQLSQAFAKGKLDGDEFRSTMENAPRLMRALTDEFGISKAELYKWSETGRLSVEKLVQAIKNQSGAIEQEFKTIPVTISGAWQQLLNVLANYIGKADQANESSKGLASTISDLANNVEPLLDFFTAIAKVEIGGLAAIAKYFAEIRDTLASIFDLQGGFAPMSEELKRIVQMGRGQVPIDQLATGRPVAGYAALNTARSYLGFSETNKKEELTDYLNKYSGTVFKDIAGEVNAWCARFVSAVLQQNGIQNPQTASARAFAQFGQSVWKKGDGDKGFANVQQGDIVVFTRGKGGHVAFVESVDLQKGTFKALGGNQGNAVSIRERSINDPNLMAVRRIGGTGDFFNGVNAQEQKLSQALKDLTDVQKMIVRKSIAAGLDPTLMLGLAQRESQFNPNAENRDGGRGLWQFMPKTGMQYGLTSEADRKNAEKSTDAAIQMFKDLLKAFDGDIRKTLAAWNMGEAGVKRRLAQGQNPEDFTEGPHVQRILEYRKQWESRLRGAMPKIMGEADLKKQNETFDKVLDDQYQAFTKHLKRLEDERSAYNTVDLAEQRTQMEKLEAQREQMRRADEAAIANAQGSGNMDAVRQASAAAAEHEIKFLKEKNKLLLDGMKIEYDAMAARKGHVQQMIADAQRNKGPEALAALPDLRSEAKQLDAQMRALMENRKQLAIKAEAEIVAATRNAEDEKRKAMQGTADIFVAQERERLDGIKEELDLRYQAAELSQQYMQGYVDEQKAAIDSTLERVKAQVTLNAEERQNAMNGKDGLEAVAQARENVNAKLRDAIALIQAEKQAALDKLNLDAQMLDYEEQIAEWKARNAGSSSERLAAEATLAKIHEMQSINAQKYLDVLNNVPAAESKARQAATKENQAIDKEELSKQMALVKEQRLRENAYWDQLIGRMRQFQTTWQQITGEASNPFADLAVQVNEMVKNIEQLGNSYENLQDAWRSRMMATSAEFRKAAEEAAKNGESLSNPVLDMAEGLGVAQQALQMMAQTMLAIRSQYKEGTKGYEEMTAAAERMMEVQRALQLVEAILGVVHQATSGDVYTTIPRMLAVGALMASLGLNTGVSGGNGSMSSSQARQAAQAGGSTSAGGGVFGDTSAKSDSIAKSLEIVSQNSSADLAYSAGMLRALTDIKYALMGTTNAVIRNVGPQSGLNLNAGMGTTIARGMLDPIGSSFAIGAKVFGDPLSKLMAKLSQFLLNTTKKITDWGLAATQQSLGDIMKGGFRGQGFTDVTTTTKVLGITVQKSTKRYFAELNGAVNSEFTRAIVGVANTVAEAGKSFGLGVKDFEDRLKGFVVNFSAISTKGLKGQELQDALTQMFSAMSDDMARAFLPGLDAFMQSGEGYLTTLVRVADGINRSTGILEQAGLKAINYQDIILKQGDVASEIVRQSIVMFEGIGSAIGAYVDQAVGSAEELMAVYQDLLIISDTAKLAGFNMNNLSNALIVTSGGVAKFLENLSTYQTEILGSSDYARQMLTLNREFAKLGEAVPANNEAFIRLVDSIDTTTESGQKLYAQILSLAGAFSKAQQEAAKLEELRAKYRPADSMAEFRKQLDQVDIDFRQIREGVLATLPGGPNYLKRIQRIESLGNLKEDRQDELDLVNEDIAKLEAKGKLTQKEKETLAGLRQQRKNLEAEIKDTDALIAKINKLIEKNKNTEELIKERNKLIEEQNDAIIKTLADIWDKMTQAITAARETLKSINDSIFELIGGTGSESMKLGMATARRVIAEGDYTRYTQNGGTDIVQLQKYADAYYRAIMDERDAKIAAIEAPMKALEKERDIRQKAHDAEINALEKQLGVAKELFDAVKGIQEYAKSLRTSAAANLSPRRQLEAAKAAYDELRAKAAAGDVEAMRKITGASDTYLDAAKKYFGTGGKYGVIFDSIVADMDKLGMRDMGDAQSIQDKIDKLNEDHGKYLDSIDRQIAALNIEEQIKAENDKTAERLKDLAKDLGPRIDAAEAQAKKDMADLIAEVGKTNGWSEKQLAALNQMLTAWGMEPIAGPTNPTTGTTPGGSGNTGNTGKPAKPTKPLNPADDPAKYDGPAAWKTWTDYWKQQQRILKNHPEWNKTWAQFKVEEFNRLQAQGMNPIVPAFASGGLAQPGWALVGEEGPELVKFGSQAQVFDADYTAKMLREIASFQPIPSQGSRPINLEKMPRIIDDIRRPDRNPARFSGDKDDVIAELRAMRTELKALVTTQSRANPAVIEQLANIERRLGYMERDQKLKPA